MLALGSQARGREITAAYPGQLRYDTNGTHCGSHRTTCYLIFYDLLVCL